MNSNEQDFQPGMIKQQLKDLKKNIDQKISAITDLQTHLQTEEQELRKQLVEEKRLLAWLNELA